MTRRSRHRIDWINLAGRPWWVGTSLDHAGGAVIAVCRSFVVTDAVIGGASAVCCRRTSRSSARFAPERMTTDIERYCRQYWFNQLDRINTFISLACHWFSSQCEDGIDVVADIRNSRRYSCTDMDPGILFSCWILNCIEPVETEKETGWISKCRKRRCADVF